MYDSLNFAQKDLTVKEIPHIVIGCSTDIRRREHVMKYYFAPMEGITGYLYRNAHQDYFPGLDRYMTPFLAPNQKTCFRTREREDVLPGHNRGMDVVPQILTNKAEEFLRAAGELKEYGYREVNLNLGCPSRTVASKCRGAGFLAVPEELDRFLDEIFEKADVEISIKTRIGKDSGEEFAHLMEIYNQYPVKELIIHPRVQKDFYRNTPNLDVFAQGFARSRCPVCYNGDIRTVADVKRIKERFPALERVMIGRGLLANPGLAGELLGEAPMDKGRLRGFHDRIYRDYQEVLFGEKNVLFKMKELWSYLIESFEDAEREGKKIRKAQRLREYEEAVEALFSRKRLAAEGDTAAFSV